MVPIQEKQFFPTPITLDAVVVSWLLAPFIAAEVKEDDG
jgi:hypothetical protein